MKHVGITDSVREWLKMSVKTLASWSTHVWNTRPGIRLACGFVNVDLLIKVLFTSATESVISLPEQLVLSCMLQCCLPQREHKNKKKRHLAHLVGSHHLAARGWVSFCSP